MPAALSPPCLAPSRDALIQRSDNPRSAPELLLPETELLALVKERWPDHDVQALDGQGGCSFTVSCRGRMTLDGAQIYPKAGGKGEADAGEAKQNFEEAPHGGRNTTRAHSVIFQFRPRRFTIPLGLAKRARDIFTPLAPWTREWPGGLFGDDHLRIPLQSLDLQVCEMEFLPGTRLSDLLPDFSRGQVLHSGVMGRYRTLLSGLAEFYARAWEAGVPGCGKGGRLGLTGRVGASINSRLTQLAQELPTQHLRDAAASALWAVEKNGGLDGLPVVLTHGDLLASNLLVDPKTWELTGVVDWAEGEDLPFGLSLYGLEHLLGTLGPWMTTFVYCGEADDLREWFWVCLRGRVKEMSDWRVREAVDLARTVGILLWTGFAWDDGRIDRVITTAVGDSKELECLNSFLRTSKTDSWRAKSWYHAG